MHKTALVSVSDKTQLIEIGKALKHFNFEIISTGGTAQSLLENNIPCTQVSDYTGFPEMMEGRIKTLHPRVHGAVLGDRSVKDHQEAANTYGIKWIDLVIVNLYPFAQVANRAKPEWKDLVENIDIGGPAMIRAAAKNHRFVTVLTDPKDYKEAIQKLKDNPQEPFDQKYRYQMALKAFKHTAEYDSLIAQTLSRFEIDEQRRLTEKQMPGYVSFHAEHRQELRYGENPHQSAAAYQLTAPKEYFPFSQSLQGKELSFNNFLDLEAAWKLLIELPENSCAIFKHNNPCGVGLGSSPHQSLARAWSADPISAFGGIVAISGAVDEELATQISEKFIEIVLAESFDLGARELLQKKKNLRLILIPQLADLKSNQISTLDVRKISGALLVQEKDFLGKFQEPYFSPEAEFVTSKKATDQELRAMAFAWTLAKNVKSNAVVITSDTRSLGIGCGQVNRKLSSHIAAEHAKNFDDHIRVCASDGFFPFTDSLPILKEAGVQLIVQPGGSMKDQEVIEECERLGMGMMLTKSRHFLH